MEESLKYFVPQIEDIRVGYECERKIYKGIGKSLDWIPCTMDFYDMQIVIIDNRPDWYRVPYLTKEQIEAEGWKGSKENFDVEAFEKNNIFISYNFRTKKMGVIVKDPSIYPEQIGNFIGEWDMPKYVGECKDINTFRYICKLLGI